jgi:ribosomal protein S18 acetylase RimI-like enzyme
MLRDMTPADYDQAVRLWHSSEGVRSAETREELNCYLDRNPGLSVVAEENGQLVAAVMGGHDGRRGYFYHLAVAGSHRRQGIARAMLQRSLARMKSEGIRRASVFVVTTNQQGQQFWQRLGWRERTDLTVLAHDLLSE